jgi:hypothetical protein
MTASITLTPDTLIIDIEGTDKLWALKSRLQVPLANVAAVAPAESEAREWLHGIRLGGTHIPGVITAGRFYSHGKWVFWDMHDPAKAICIELRNEHYSKLIVEVDNPEDQISQIRQATGQTQGRMRMASGGSSQTAGMALAAHRGRAERHDRELAGAPAHREEGLMTDT